MNKLPNQDRTRLFTGMISLTISCLVLYMLYRSPFRLDDLTWGGRIGIDRLHSLFAGYNGRYAGNLVVLFLTRLPSVIRVITEGFLLFLLFYLVRRILDQDDSAGLFFCCLFFTMPLTIFTQTVTWVSGFSNYFVSALIFIFILYEDLKIIEKDPSSVSPAYNLFFYCVVFAGQLFVESMTLFMIPFSLGILVLYYLVRKKSSVKLLLQTVLSIAGAVIMFTNSAYFSALTHDGGTYKSIDLGSGGLWGFVYSLLKTYKETIAFKWFGMNTLLNPLLALILLVFCFRCGQKRAKLLLQTAGSCFLALFIYDLADGEKTALFSGKIMVITSALFLLYIAGVILFLVEQRSEKRKLMILLLSQFVLMVPLTVVSPVNDRCVLINYILWALLAVSFLHLPEMRGLFSQTRQGSARLIMALFLIAYLAGALKGQALSWKIEDLRMQDIAAWHESHSPELVIPEVPDANLYCYGANLSGEYWLNNYKEYYGIDKDVDLQFLSYKKYMKRKSP